MLNFSYGITSSQRLSRVETVENVDINVVSSTTASAWTSSLNVTKPTGTANGDSIVIFVGTQGGAEPYINGFDKIGQYNNLTIYHSHYIVFFRKAGNFEPSSYVVQNAVNMNMSAVAVTLRDTGGFFVEFQGGEVAGSTVASNSALVPNYVAPVPGFLLAGGTVYHSDGVPTYTYPVGYTGVNQAKREFASIAVAGKKVGSGSVGEALFVYPGTSGSWAAGHHLFIRGTAVPVEPPPSADLLTWEPPTGWESYTPYTLPAGGGTITLSDSLNYKLINPAGGKITGTLTIKGGRNIVWFAGHSQIDTFVSYDEATQVSVRIWRSDSQPNTPPYTVNDGRIVHIEGLLVNGFYASGDIIVNAPEVDLRLQNVRVECGMWGRNNDPEGNSPHPDVLQPWGAAKFIRVDKLTGLATYQGLMWKNDIAGRIRGPVYMKRTNIRAQSLSANVEINSSNPPSTSPLPSGRLWPNYLWWTKSGEGSIHVETGTVWISHPYRTFTTSGNQIFWPHLAAGDFGNDGTGRFAMPLDNTVDWSGLSRGKVYQGVPPGGDYCPAGLAGSLYESPGYLPQAGGQPASTFSDDYDLFGLEGRSTGSNSGFAFNTSAPTLKDGTPITGSMLTYYNATVAWAQNASATQRLTSTFNTDNSYSASRNSQPIVDAIMRSFRLTGDLRLLDALVSGFNTLASRFKTTWIDYVPSRFDGRTEWATPGSVRNGVTMTGDPWHPYPIKSNYLNGTNWQYGTDVSYLNTLKLWALASEFAWALHLNRLKSSPAGHNYATLSTAWSLRVEQFVKAWSETTSAHWSRNYRGVDELSATGHAIPNTLTSGTRHRQTWGLWPFWLYNGHHPALDSVMLARYCGLLARVGAINVPNPVTNGVYASDVAAREMVRAFFIGNPHPSHVSYSGPYGDAIAMTHTNGFTGDERHIQRSTYLGYAGGRYIQAWLTGAFRAGDQFTRERMLRLSRGYLYGFYSDGRMYGNILRMVDGQAPLHTFTCTEQGTEQSVTSNVQFGRSTMLVFSDSNSDLNNISTTIQNSNGGGYSTPNYGAIPSAQFVRSALLAIGDLT
jgi:hypothetical protein